MQFNYTARTLEEEESFSVSRRARVAGRKYYGTLNLFGGGNDSAEAPDDSNNAHNSDSENRVPAVDLPSAPRRHAYHNKESHATREFPLRSVRRVVPVAHRETPKGVRCISSAAGNQQSLQVVNISPAYTDPTQMPVERRCVQFYPEWISSSNVKKAIAYADCQRDQLRGELSAAPVGSARRPRAECGAAVLDYTRQERFCQSVRNHVLQRARGATDFYVQLCRDSIGDITASTPKPVYVRWSLEQEPVKRHLTLLRCRDQLVSLTGIPVTLLELADLMWEMDAYKARDTEWNQEEELGGLRVLFKDFASAFGQNSTNERLAVMKI